MKKNFNNNLPKRILAIFLSFVMVLSIVPSSSFSSFAARPEEYGNKIIISLVDRNDNPLENSEISYSIDSDVNIRKDKGKTDENGILVIMTSLEYEKYKDKEIIISGEISKDGYKTVSINEKLNSSTQDIHVKLDREIKVEATKETYNNKEFPAAKVSGILDGDKITYSLNKGDFVSKMPKIKEAGDYELLVKLITKDNEEIIETVYPKINKANIDLIIENTEHIYTGEEQDAFVIKGLENDDNVYYLMNGRKYFDIPKITNAGDYEITINVERNNNYEIYNEKVTVKISPKEISRDDIVVELADNWVYDGSYHSLIKKVSGRNFKFRYKVNDGKWVLVEPREKDAGEYKVLVEAYTLDGNYNSILIDDLDPVIVEEKEGEIVFKNYTDDKYTDNIVGEFPIEGKKYDLSAKLNRIDLKGKFSYRIENSPENEGVADINPDTGELIVKMPGEITIVATFRQSDGEENSNYKKEFEKRISFLITQGPEFEGQFIYFSNKNIDYIFGENNYIVSEQTPYKNVKRNLSYKYYFNITNANINSNDSGLDINNNGQLRIDNPRKLNNILRENNGELKIKVTAETRKKFWMSQTDKASYNVTIKYLDPPENAYSISGDKGDNGWYISQVYIYSEEDFQISKEQELNFKNKASFYEDGDFERHIQLRSTTGGITGEITINNIKIDTKAPDSNNIEIEYSEPILNKILWFYNGPVTINFTGYDETSGIDKFIWKYNRDIDSSTSNLKEDSGEVQANLDTSEKNKYTASITLPKNEVEQLRGNISVIAKDMAGLQSYEKRDDGRTIVVDTISPTREVTYQLKDPDEKSQVVDDRYYFSGDVEFSFHITEANFFEEDVIIKVLKDGGEEKEITLNWTETDNLDEHIGKYILSGDGDYTFTMEYVDRSGNVMDKYESEVITIDTISPIVEFTYSNGNNTSADKDNEQKATITIKEHNFDPSYIDLQTIVKDINGNELVIDDLENILREGKWENIGEDLYEITLADEFIDGIYELTLNYKDLALNPSEEVKSGKFIVDHRAPEEESMEISYSTPITEVIKSIVTFGYYNPSLKVTFTTKDMTSGVDYFAWSYSKEKGASDVNVEKYLDQELKATQDNVDKSKFTASVILPNKVGEQLRGKISFLAVDKYSNETRKLTDDGNVIVVDTIAPTMKVEYSEAENIVKNKMYYKKDMSITFTITEANFYSEDVLVELSKDGEKFKKIDIDWKNISGDNYLGTYWILGPKNHIGDGDYVIRVQYVDRSNNKMDTYTSDTIVIDTIKPSVQVSYSNKNVRNTMKDFDGNLRKYFNSSQKATITIIEHNFNSEDVEFSISGKDGNGNNLNENNLYEISQWKSSGDRHEVTINYPGDANYSFDVEYMDYSKNEIDDYKTDYFTVDKKGPSDMTVSYNTSILDTILEGISFGFYNGKVRVTISAVDNISTVNEFKYSYKLAQGVSQRNAELIDQIISEAEITYSNGYKMATSTFDIPKSALDSNNQFNGTISFIAIDRSTNESSPYNGDKRLVVDNLNPTLKVEYNDPVQVLDGVSYYSGNVNASLTIDEANFYPNDVEISITKDGNPYSINPSWSNNSTDIHVGTFSLSEDGDYLITINYSDKSANKMDTYKSDQITIDTKIEDPIITINGEEANGKAFKDEVVPFISFEDINLDTYEINLTRTRYFDIDKDVKDEFVGDNLIVTNKGASGKFDTFTKVQDTDGIYKLNVKVLDKAGNSAEKSILFTVNRFGSVYVYNDYLISLIKDGGAYVKDVSNDLVITEYNPDKLLDDSLNIDASRDGKPLKDLDYFVNPEINNEVSLGDSGWYQYSYTISKDNFDTDGIYKMAVSSKDSTGNKPETTNYKDKNILFRVDSTKPEINSITGFENEIINAQNVVSKYTVYDAIGLKSVKVYVDGENVETITDFGNDFNNYNGSFSVSEKNSSQKIRLVVEDLAGNISDTDSDDFKSAFPFVNSVIVSTNFFVRFFANKVLFWGSIGGISLLIVFLLILLGKRRNKDEEEIE